VRSRKFQLNNVSFQVIRWRETLYIPKNMISYEAEDLIRGLCTGADKRLGSRQGAAEIKSHPFFNGIDFSKSLRLQRAPWRPEILHETDTSNFDPVDPDRLGNDNSDSENDDPSKDSHGFYEFTFRRFFDDGGHPLPLADDRSGSSASTATTTSAPTTTIAPDPVYV
jgi:hypothetical protein